MDDRSKYLGCESAEEKRQRTLREKLAAETKYQDATKVLEDFERDVFGQVETETIRRRRSEVCRERQAAHDRMTEARMAHNFTNRVTREGHPPPKYRPELASGNGQWTKR